MIVFFNYNLRANNPNSIAVGEKLTIRFMNLKEVKIDTERARTLSELDVSGNPIEGLPATLKLAKNLKVLRLNFCTQLDLVALARLIKNLLIEEIELNNCQIIFIPFEITGIKTLKKISLENNMLQELPWNIFYNDSLKYLNIAHNNIEQLDGDIEKASGLTYLNISYNPMLYQITFLANVSNLEKLQTLECSGVSVLPKEWLFPRSLTSLVMDDCKADFPKKISGCENIENLSMLRYNYGEIEQILSTWGCTNIKTLAVSGTIVDKIPDNIGALKKLEKLDFGCQTLSSTPNLSGLEALKEVHLAITDTVSLQSVLKSLASVKVLQVLDLKGCNFKSLPVEIKSLASLQEFSAENTNTQNIGSCLFSLTNLKAIELRGNKISGGQMQELKKKLPNAQVYFDALLPTEGVINKPFPAINLKPEEFTVNNQRDTLIKTTNGTEIKIPAHSIVDKDKKEVKGSVKVNFTSYYDPLEIYTSGITMTADSGGVKKDFASAGMFTLNAKTNNNQDAYVKKGKKLEVNFVSKSPNQPFNYYYLDTTQKNWVQIGKDNLNTDVKRKMIRKYPTMPQNPFKIKFAKISTHITQENSKSPVYFTLSVPEDKRKDKNLKKDTLYYDPYEINVLSRNSWKYAGDTAGRFYNLMDSPQDKYFISYSVKKNKKRKKDLFLHSKEGVEIVIRPNREKDCFDIIFYLYNDSMIVEAIPAISNTDPSKTQANIKRSYENYVIQYNQNTSSRINRVSKFNKKYKEYLQSMTNYERLCQAYNNKDVSDKEYKKLYDAVLKNEWDTLLQKPATVDNIIRSFQVTGFGTYNCDYFFRPENTIVSTPYFVNVENKTRVNVSTITLIDLKENSYIQAKAHELKFAPERSYWVFAKTSDNRTCFASFTTGSTNNGLKSIPVKIVNATSIEDLRKQLEY